MIVCAGRNETFSFAQTIGVGLIESAINLTKICISKKPESILFVGSAGSYGKHKIFDIIESQKAVNIELSYLDNNSYTPLYKVDNKKDNILKEEIINSSNYISINEELTKKFDNYSISAENMEFYSILKVAEEFKIPAKGIFVITNYTNKNAHEDFIKNHNEAMEKLTNYLIEKNLIK